MDRSFELVPKLSTKNLLNFKFVYYGILDRSLLDKNNCVWRTEEQCDVKVRRFCRSSSATINVVAGESDGGVDGDEEQKETRKRKRNDAHLNRRFPKAVGGRVVSKGYGHSMMNLVYRRTGLSVLNRNRDDGPGGTSAC